MNAQLFLQRFTRQLRQQAQKRLPQRLHFLLRFPGWLMGLGGLALMLALPALYRLAAPGGSAATPSSTELALKAILNLSIVLALIYLCAAAVRAFWRPAAKAGRSRVVVVESTRLAQRQALHLVQVGDRSFLIGSTDQAISLLAEVGADSSGADCECAQPVTHVNNFETLFESLNRVS